ncbi:hypothetical protein OKW96_15960 [Sphingobacterium sp. KU25419]|nr:hypothetical protein OKW96_15960 [Sphingobacterium sp. KU25419]
MIRNKLLLQQADQCKVSIEGLEENAIELLQIVGQFYDDYEKKQMHLNQTVKMCSSEMIALNAKLMRESKELKMLFETMKEVFFSVNMETGQLINISQACETVYGYSVGDFMNTPNYGQN